MFQQIVLIYQLAARESEASMNLVLGTEEVQRWQSVELIQLAQEVVHMRAVIDMVTNLYKGAECDNKISSYKFLKKDSARWSYFISIYNRES
jgi:hypothetical protein